MIPEIEAYLEKGTDEQSEILKMLRSLILELSPDIQESYKWSRPVYATDKDIIYLQVTKKSVNLGFFEYTKVKSNAHLLEGTGKSMRHIKIKRKADIESFSITSILKEIVK